MACCIPYIASSPRSRAQLQRCSYMSSKLCPLNPSRYKTLLLQKKPPNKLKSKTKPAISLHCPRNLKNLVSLLPCKPRELEFQLWYSELFSIISEQAVLRCSVF